MALEVSILKNDSEYKNIKFIYIPLLVSYVENNIFYGVYYLLVIIIGLPNKYSINVGCFA